MQEAKNDIPVFFKKKTEEKPEADNWVTPDWILCLMESLLGVEFVIDAAADIQNSKGSKGFITEETNALNVYWANVMAPYKNIKGAAFWCNPPYSYTAEFCEKAISEHALGVPSVTLVPSRLDRDFWHDAILPKATAVFFIRRRMSFVMPGGRIVAPHTAGFSSMLMYCAGRDKEGPTRMLSIDQPPREFRYTKPDRRADAPKYAVTRLQIMGNTYRWAQYLMDTAARCNSFLQAYECTVDTLA